MNDTKDTKFHSEGDEALIELMNRAHESDGLESLFTNLQSNSPVFGLVRRT